MSAISEHIELHLPGCYLFSFNANVDSRGVFIKNFQKDNVLVKDLGLSADWQEEYFTISHKGVVRGMHLQVAPSQCDKLVTCITGVAFDVLLDLRPGSFYGQWVSLDLCPATAVYIPAGVAHGFQAVVEGTALYYKVTSMYSPNDDCGIRWDSFGVVWPLNNPLLSTRDKAFPTLKTFKRSVI